MVSRYGPVKQEGLCILPPPPTHYRMLPPQSKLKNQINQQMTHHVLILRRNHWTNSVCVRSGPLYNIRGVVVLRKDDSHRLSACALHGQNFFVFFVLVLFLISRRLIKQKPELSLLLLLLGWAVVIAFIITCIMLVDLAS